MMIERRKMTRATYQALKRYILHEREKKKQEQEQDKAQERLRRERELQKKKEEEDSLTLEQTKEQLVQLEAKLDALKQEKHGLFSELKKVLHQENEMRQRAQMKEQNEIAALQQQQFTSGLPQGPVTGHPLFLQTNMVTRPSSKYLNVTSHQPVTGQGMKRQRSPSPPPSAAQYSQHYASQYPPSSLYSGSGSGGAPNSIKQEPYSAASEYGKNPTKTESSSYGGSYGQPTGHSAYGSQQAPPQAPLPAQQYQQSSGQAGAGSGPGKYSTSTVPAQSQSAFSSYPAPISAGYSIYQPQVQGKPQQPQSLVAEQFAAYPRQSAQPRRPPQQSGYLSPHHGLPSGAQPLQQQLEHASQKAGFVDVKSHQQAIRAANVVAAQQQMTSGHPPRGSIVTGYPIRPPPQQGPTTSVYSGAGSGSLVPPRHSNHNQSRY